MVDKSGEKDKKIDAQNNAKDSAEIQKTFISKVKNTLSHFQNFLLYGDSKINTQQDLHSLEELILQNHKDSPKKSPHHEVHKDIDDVLSGSKKFLEDLKKETIPVLTVYQVYRHQFETLTKKFGNQRILGLIEDIVDSGLDVKIPADKGRIDSILRLFDSVPYVIANLLF